MKKKLLALCCVAVLAAGIMTGCGCSNTANTSSDTAKNDSNTPAQTAQPVHITPTMWYLVSNSDANLDAEKKLVEEIQNEYKDKAVIQIINIDENEQMAMLTNVTSKDTPAALMLDETGSTSGNNPIVFHCETKEQIVEALNSGIK
ncbi:MAG: hypothetical protein IJL81_03765 [Clostridia bacterium]|nr:hypothetical protein [Clostridia bacterium]